MASNLHFMKWKRGIIMKLIIILLSFLSVSCQTVIESTEAYKKRTTYLVYSTDIKAEGIKSCELSIAKKGDSLMKDIIIAASQSAYAAELEPGIYSFETLNCGGQFVELKSKLRKFRIRKNRLNYIANLSIEKGESNKIELKINAGNLDKVFSLSSLQKTRKKLRFAYNGKKIKKTMLNAENTGKLKLKLRYNKVRPSINLSIKECRLKSKSPVFIGHLDFSVEYQGYRLSKLNLDSNYSNLDRKDINCIKEKLSNIKPENNGSFAAMVSVN